GFLPTDVETFRGWHARGRQVRKGSVGLRISVPISPRKTDGEQGDDGACVVPPTDDKSERGETGEKTEKKRPMFRTISVFDISQTDPLEKRELSAPPAGSEVTA